MAPRHGIAVHAGSNFSLVPHLRARASVQLTTARVTLIVIAIALVVCGIFCCGVGILMWKTQSNKKKRDRKMAASRVESQPFVHHQYTAIGDMNTATHTSMGYVQELSDENQSFQMSTAGQKSELAARNMAHNIDGFAAPPRANTRPVELPSNVAYQLPTWKP